MRYQHTLSFCLIVVATCATAAPPHTIDFPTVGTRSKESIVVLAIDDQLLPLRHNLCYYISKPSVRTEPVLKPERDNPNAPDEMAAHFYGTVIKDGDKFRMWYYGARRAGGRWKIVGQACYAESADGVNWRKPPLEQVEIHGSRQNNALALVDVDMQGVTVIRDDDDPQPSRRYKMVLQYMPGDYATLKTAVSSDGLEWTLGADLPQLQFREQASFFKHNGLFIVCGHTTSKGESGSARGRQGFAWVSPDFDHWPIEEAESFALPEPPDTRGDKWKEHFDQVHLGVGAASLGNVAVGLYGLWHERGWGAGGTSCDLGLLISNDGIHFREPVQGHHFIAADAVPTPSVNGQQLPTLLCQANGILNVGDETRIYYGRWRNSEWPLKGDGSNYYAEIGLATLPRDRWGAVGLIPGASEGSVWSAPIKLPNKCVVSLNAEGSGAMRVEVADEDFHLLPDFSESNSGTCSDASGIDCPVKWPTGTLEQLCGKTVRLRLHIKREPTNAKLYAIYLGARDEH